MIDEQLRSCKKLLKDRGYTVVPTAELAQWTTEMEESKRRLKSVAQAVMHAADRTGAHVEIRAPKRGKRELLMEVVVCAPTSDEKAIALLVNEQLIALFKELRNVDLERGEARQVPGPAPQDRDDEADS